MKVTTSDLLAILRRFGEADNSHVPRLIDQVTQSHPSPTNQLVKFRFNRHHYFVLLDESAEDNARYILGQIQQEKSDAAGELLLNPTTHIETHGLPFKGKDAYLFKLNDGKQRLDARLVEQFPEINRSTWQKYIKAGYVTVNNTAATKSSQEVSAADHIATTIPEGTDHSAKELPIIYLDDDVIVINKPAGMLTHSKGAMNDEFTVADFFRRYTTVGLETNRPGVVHRLDRDTSGVIIGARTPESFDRLKQQFSERKAKKTYLAVVVGQPKEPRATVDVPIARHPSAPSTFRADSKGKEAITEYHTLATNGKQSLLALQPHTGRTHQLRVHLAHLGTPIIGDRVYGKAGGRLLLHAYRLEVTTIPEQRHTFTAPIPAEFTAQFPEATHDIAHI
jgi:23S rRNA pseudouridine1911/1915/1917 synthase